MSRESSIAELLRAVQDSVRNSTMSDASKASVASQLAALQHRLDASDVRSIWFFKCTHEPVCFRASEEEFAHFYFRVPTAQQSDRRSTIVGGSAGALLPTSFTRSDAPAEYAPLPAAFGGAKNLIMPHYLAHRSSGVTLPSRLSSLGSTEFVSIAAMSALDVGNSVVVCLLISRLSRCTGHFNQTPTTPASFWMLHAGLYHICFSRNIRSRRFVLFLLHLWQALVKFVQEVGIAALYLQQVDGAECVA
jgi:hypothetical protein